MTENESEMSVIPISLCYLHHSADWPKVHLCVFKYHLPFKVCISDSLSNPCHQCCHGITNSQLSMALAAEQ